MTKHCEFPPGDCGAEPVFYLMGAYPGDWAVRVCAEHQQWARKAMAPWIEEPIRPVVLL